MTAEYRPVEYGKDYDVVNNPDKFQLYIDVHINARRISYVCGEFCRMKRDFTT